MAQLPHIPLSSSHLARRQVICVCQPLHHGSTVLPPTEACLGAIAPPADVGLVSIMVMPLVAMPSVCQPWGPAPPILSPTNKLRLLLYHHLPYPSLWFAGPKKELHASHCPSILLASVVDLACHRLLKPYAVVPVTVIISVFTCETYVWVPLRDRPG